MVVDLVAFQFHRKGVADEEALQRAEVMAKKAVTKRRRIAATDARKSMRRANQMSSNGTGTEEVETSEEMVAMRSPSPRKTRPRRAAAASKSHVVFSSDEEEAEDED